MRALAVYILIILFLYIGFYMVETGVTELQAKVPENRALMFHVEDNMLFITFSGDLYEVDLTQIHDYFTTLIKDRLNP